MNIVEQTAQIMGLFKRGRESDSAQKARPSTGETISVRLKEVRNLLGKKRGQTHSNASVSSANEPKEDEGEAQPTSTALESDSSTDLGDPHTIPSLWDRAYDALQKKNVQLVRSYEALLDKESPGTGTYLEFTLQMALELTTIQIPSTNQFAKRSWTQ